MSRRAALAAALLATALAALAGCAKKGPPSGGPPDITPPTIVSSSPDSGSAGVSRSGPLSITFSEGMEPRGTGDAIALAPRVAIRQRRWKGRTVTIVLADTLAADQTYTLFVGGGARDRHGNPLETGGAIVFNTGPSFPSGMIAGRIQARGFAPGGTYLWCYRAGREPDSTARDFDALGLADDGGNFRVPGLRVPGTYRLWAFADLNHNRSFEPQSDILAPADTSFALTTDAPVDSGLRLTIVNPRAPGRVRGAVLDSLADSLGVLRVIAVADDDSTRRVLAEVDRDGKFDLSLRAGTWWLRAWRDLDRNRLWRATDEPASDRLPVKVKPTDDIQGVELVLRRPGGGTPSE